MDKPNLFNLIEGLKPVDASALAEYERAMTEEGIPAIVEAVDRRERLAAQSRYRELEIPEDAGPVK
jgi:hypothetical protein